MDYETLEKRLAAWAARQPDVRALVVVGSRGRRSRPADAWSDLDVLMLTSAPDQYGAEPGWPQALGDVWLAERSFAGPGDTEWEVIFDGGLKADVVAVGAPEEEPLGATLARIPYQGVLGRGVRFLFVREGEQTAGPWPAPPGDGLPSAEEFRNLVAGFYVTAWRTATMIRRGDLWRAHYRADADLKAALLQLLEWHARAQRGAEVDTWYDGRFIAEWADPRAVAHFAEITGGYAPAEQWAALRATLTLFRWLAVECGERLGYAPPLEGADRVAARIEQLLVLG